MPLERKYNVVCGGIGVVRKSVFGKLLKFDPTVYLIKDEGRVPSIEEVEAVGMVPDRQSEPIRLLLDSFRLRGTREKIKCEICKQIDKICDNIDPIYDKEDIDDEERVANKSW